MSKPIKIILGLVVIAVIGAAVWWKVYNKPEDVTPVSGGASESSFLLNEIYYGCSRKISGRWVEARIGPMGSPGHYFQPSNQEDFKKYCREEAIIEYQSVLDILGREDVSEVIERYSTAEAWVRALGHKYINDKDYLKRVLPAFSDMNIDCIIVVHTPEGTRFFIENGDVHNSHNDHKYLEIPSSVFLVSLNGAPDTDVTDFWLGLH